VSRLVFWASGVRLDRAPFGRYFQFVDPDLLQHQLAQSLWYLHSQPPLFNAFLGLVVKLPGPSRPVFWAAYVLFGLALTLLLFRLLIAFGFTPWVAAGIAGLYAISPQTVLLENWLFYDYPVTALLVGSVLALNWFVRSPSAWSGSAFFGLIAALVLTRSVFQLAWVALAFAVAAVACPRWRLLSAVAAAPLALVLLVYVKNLVLFGTFVTSSWYGMSLAQTTMPNISVSERAALVHRGDLSRLVLIYPFSPLRDFPHRWSFVSLRHVTVLDRAVYAPTERNNFNHSAYLGISAQYFRDWRWVILHRPGAYLDGVANGGRIFFDPVENEDAFLRDGNMASLGRWDRAYRDVFFSVARLGIRFRLISVLWTLTLLYAAVRLPFWLRDRRVPRATKATLVYICLAVLYVVAAWLSTDVGEAFRARATLEPLVLFVLLPYAVREVGLALASRVRI
jgi:hypothetical protein